MEKVWACLTIFTVTPAIAKQMAFLRRKPQGKNFKSKI